LEGHELGKRTSASAGTPGRRRAAPSARPDAHRAGLDVVGALMDEPTPAAPKVDDAETAVQPAVAPPPPAPPAEPTPPAPEVKRPRAAQPTGVSTEVRFPPKRGSRQLMDAVVLLVLVATALAAYVAYDDPNTFTIGAAATTGVLLLVVWAIRAGTPITYMTVKGGQLEVKQGGLHLKFDLTSHYAPIQVQGTPGRRGWRVLFGRGTMRPFVVDSSMVDPRTFTEVLESYRPV
jgi:hypothetical protein